MIVSSILIPGLAWCQEDNTSAPGTGWEALNLGSTTIEGTRVFYEKCLEPNLPVFEAEYRKVLAERERVRAFVGKRQEILADIRRIIGWTDPNGETLSLSVLGFLEGFRQARQTYYLVTRPTLKAFLRSGGQLPDFIYDKAKDTAFYEPAWRMKTGGGPVKDLDLTLPIDPNKDVPGQIGEFLRAMREVVMGAGLIGGGIHEVAEVALLHRARPTDSYWRWFSDGFANVIAIEILQKYLGKEAGDGFASAYDVNKYKDLEKEINLGYWISGGYAIFLTRTPIEAENKIFYARYAYATLEAQRLVDRHGLEVLRKVLDEVAVRESRTGRDLIDAIQKVTGEDMKPRLAVYQGLQSREELLSKYEKALHAASEKRDLEQMLVNLIRVHELRPSLTAEFVVDYGNAAMLTLRLGHEQTADKIVEDCVRFFSDMSPGPWKQAALEVFISYAMGSGKPRKAEKAAEELLRIAPDSTSALAVQMMVHVEDKSITEAKDLATRIIRLSKDTLSPAYKTALRVQAMDPNQPSPGLP